MSKISELAYTRYQFDWMVSHGYDIDSLSNVANEWEQECREALFQLDRRVPGFSDYLFEHGFDGEIWACYDEFLQAEYLDAGYMKAILNEAEYKEYCQEVFTKTPEKL